MSLCFGFERGEELRGHHLGRALNHALADAGNRAADLHVTRVLDHSRAFALCEIEIACAFQETRLTLAINHDAIVLRLAYIFESDVALKDTFDRAHARAQRGRKGLLARLLQTLAARNATHEHRAVKQRREDSLTRRAQFMCAFEFHNKQRAVQGSRLQVQGQRLRLVATDLELATLNLKL